MVEILDLETQMLLIKLYNQLEGKAEVSIGAPKYDKSQVDILVDNKLIQVIDTSSMEGWGYIVRGTYQGNKYVENIQDSLHFRIQKFLMRGEEIGIKELHDAKGISSVSGPLFNAWIDEIKVFNERYLRKHPLYESISSTCFHKKNMYAYLDMMGHLNALLADEELDKYYVQSKKIQPKTSVLSLEQMLDEDIIRCEDFLADSQNTESGTDLYVEITGKYDAIIPNFGNGLYQYVDEFHFYEPNISNETLVHNMKKLIAKMKAYQITNGYQIEKKKVVEKDKGKMSNKVFIVHGHDELAAQEMARTLEKWGFEAIILHEQADQGLTIIEKIEKYTDVDYAVVLYTECDYGRAKDEAKENERFRARQNVVFEHGYLISKLHREHVCALVKGNVETPGDISGVVYVAMDSSGGWKMQLAKNMKAVGFNIDMDKFLS